MIAAIKKLIKSLKKKSTKRFRYMRPMDNPQNYPNMGSTDYSVFNTISGGNFVTIKGSSTESKKDERVIKKPVEVVKEIVIDKPILSLDNLDNKIKIVERRISVLEEQDIKCSDENIALTYLYARKKYLKYEKLFPWATTTSSKVQWLCGIYKLRTSTLAANYKNIPMEAIDELEKFANAFNKVLPRENPIFTLVVDEGGKEEKKDPILLASSPFGNYLYILGAWDREVEIVDELVYRGK